MCIKLRRISRSIQCPAVPGFAAYLAAVKFLVIQTAFIGDVILATAVLEKLHAFYPGARIDLLVQKGNASLFHRHPFLHEVLVFDKKQNRSRSLYELISRIRKTRYDVVINLHRFFSSGLITVLSGANQTIGFDKNPLSVFFGSRVRHTISSTGVQHEVQRNLSLISPLTDETLSTPPRLYPPPEAYARFVTQAPYVCMAPASVWFTKQWPAEKWIALINALADRYEIYLLGSPQDKALCESICARAETRRTTVLAGELTLLESAALMQGAVMNYVNDSAPMHLASAVNAPVTVIYCSTVPAFGFGPLSDVSNIMETTEPLSCRPCGLHGHRACPQGHFSCAEIDVLRVMQTAVREF